MKERVLDLRQELLHSVDRLKARWKAKRFARWVAQHAPDFWSLLTAARLPAELWEKVLEDLSSEPYQAILSTWSNADHPIHADVAFVVRRLTPDILKDVIALRKDLPELRVVVLGQSNELTAELNRHYVSEFYRWEGYLHLVLLVKRLRVKSLIISRRGGAHGIVLAAIFWKGERLIYRPYPFSHRDPDGVAPSYDLQAEKIIIERAFGLYHFFHDEIEKQLQPLMKVPSRVIQILPGCLEELKVRPRVQERRRDPGDLHVVYAAGLFSKGRQTKGYRTGYIRDIPEKFEILLKSGIHVHVYTPYICRESLNEAILVLEEFPLFHLEGTLDYMHLLEVLPKYDWALYHFSLECHPIRSGFDWFASNAFFTFIQAGLPVIVSPTTPAYAELVKRYNIGVVVDDAGFRSIGQILRSSDLSLLKKNTADAYFHLQYPFKRLQELVLS